MVKKKVKNKGGYTVAGSVSDPYSLNPDPAKNLNPDPDPGKFFSPTKKFA